MKHIHILCKCCSYSVIMVEAMDLSLLRGLFLQRLPSNVRMILALTANKSDLQELAEIADSVMEVILLSIAMVTTPQATKVRQLKTEVASIGRQVYDF